MSLEALLEIEVEAELSNDLLLISEETYNSATAAAAFNVNNDVEYTEERFNKSTELAIDVTEPRRKSARNKRRPMYSDVYYDF